MIELDRLIAELRAKNGSEICIFTHNNPDPDAIASAFGLKHLFEQLTSSRVTIAYDGIITRVNNKTMIQLLDIPIISIKSLNLEQHQVFCSVDSQPGSGNSSFPTDRIPFLVVDHHPAKLICPAAEFCDIRPEVGSTSSIVCEYLDHFSLAPPSDLATALYYGIKTDTDGLSRDTSPQDRTMFFRLYPSVDPEKLARIEKPDLPRAYYHDIGDALLTARIYNTILVSDLHEVWSPEMPAEMADFLLRMEGVDTTLVFGLYEAKIYFSMRTSRAGLNLGDVALRMAGEEGTAGGHNRAAGGLILGSPENLRKLQDRFFQCFAIDEQCFSTILGDLFSPTSRAFGA